MISRVTTQTMAASAMRQLQSSKIDLASQQQRASSLQAIGKPSDDPSATGDSLRVRSAQRAEAQYARNISDGDNWLTSVDSSLSNVTTLLNRVRDLTVRGANDGALSPSAKEAIAVELDGLKADLLKESNATYLGRSVFAGTSDAGVAFRSDYSFTGVAGAAVDRRIGTDRSVRVDADGSAVFGAGVNSVFALVDGIASDLRSGNNVGARLASIDSRMNTVAASHTDIGARQSTITRAQESNMKNAASLEAQRAGIEDLDLGSMLLDLQVQELNYKSALAVTARVLQPTLMDFLS